MTSTPPGSVPPAHRSLESFDASLVLAAIVDSSDDAIVSKTVDGIVTSWNRAAEKMFGYTASEAIGRSIKIIIPPERWSEEEEVLNRIRRGERVDHFETIRVRKDDAQIDISLTVSPIRDQRGRVIGASKSARDITSRRRGEEERETLLARTQAARAAAEEANRAKDEFLAMLGHELRNPLGAISTAAFVLGQSENMGENANRARDVISRQVRHLARLVDDLLDVARLTTGKIVLDRRHLDLAEVVRQTIRTFDAAGRTTQHILAVDAESVWVDADPVRVEQIVANLLSNALKYTLPGRHVRVAVRRAATNGVVEVEDSGTGISSGLLPRVFDLFVQGDQTLDRVQSGLGIGLTMVRRLVELHGGTVEASSEGLWRGSRFTVRLPSLPVPSLDERAVHRGRQQGEPNPRRILLVEDSADSRTMLRQMLEAAGHEVLETENGPRGVEIALSSRPDIALINLGLPGLDGYEVAKRIRAEQEGRGIRLVALTGYGRPEAREGSRRAGFDAHLVKPIDPDRLDDALSGRSPRESRPQSLP